MAMSKPVPWQIQMSACNPEEKFDICWDAKIQLITRKDEFNPFKSRVFKIARRKRSKSRSKRFYTNLQQEFNQFIKFYFAKKKKRPFLQCSNSLLWKPDDLRNCLNPSMRESKPYLNMKSLLVTTQDQIRRKVIENEFSEVMGKRESKLAQQVIECWSKTGNWRMD